MKQSIEKNAEKLIAIVLSCAVIVLNVGSSCKNTPKKCDFIDTDNLVHASELPDINYGRQEIVSNENPTPRLELLKSKNNTKIDCKTKKYKPDSSETAALEVIPVELENEMFLDVLEEIDCWDDLLEDYDQYETDDAIFDSEISDNDEPDETLGNDVAQLIKENSVTTTIYDDTCEPDCEPLAETPNKYEEAEKTGLSYLDTTIPLPTEREIGLPPSSQQPPDRCDPDRSFLSPQLIKTPFGTYIDLQNKEEPCDLPKDIEQIDTTPESNTLKQEPDEPIYELEPSIRIYDPVSNSIDLDKISEQGINGISKNIIKNLLMIGIPAVSVLALIGIPLYMAVK